LPGLPRASSCTKPRFYKWGAPHSPVFRAFIENKGINTLRPLGHPASKLHFPASYAQPAARRRMECLFRLSKTLPYGSSFEKLAHDTAKLGKVNESAIIYLPNHVFWQDGVFGHGYYERLYKAFAVYESMLFDISMDSLSSSGVKVRNVDCVNTPTSMPSMNSFFAIRTV